MASSPVWFSIPEFYGIRQDMDSRLLPFGTAYTAKNIETSDGNLSVAKGFTKYLPETNTNNHAKVPDGGNTSNKPRALVIAHTNSGTDKIYVVSVYRIYVWNPTTSQWDMLNRPDGTGFNFYSANPPLPGLTSIFQIDKLQTRIGSDDSILIGTGKHRIIKINIGNDTAEEFGSGAYYEMGQSSAYSSLTITMSAALTDEAKRRALLYGVYLTNSHYYAEVDSIPNNTTIKLKASPGVALSAPFYVTTRGGSSDAKINFIETFANRLFAAGDPDNPCRLYWSCVPGDGRTYEDWFMVEGSEDASGGYVEVNADDGDPIIGITALSNQLLIFKRHSVWRLYGDRPSTFTLERVEKNSDMMSNRGVIVRHDVPYFLMPDGVYTYDGVGIAPLDGGTSHLKRFFQGEDDYNYEAGRPKIDRSTCAFWNNRLYFSYRIGDNTQREENGLVVYDAARGTYMLRDGFTLVDLAVSGSDILMLRNDGYVFKFESGNTYIDVDGNEEGIWAAWRTQWTDFGKKMYVHQVMAMYLQLLNDDVKIVANGDYMDDEQNVKKTTERAGYTVARFRTDQSHYFRFYFSNQIDTQETVFSIQGGVNIKALSELKE